MKTNLIIEKKSTPDYRIILKDTISNLKGSSKNKTTFKSLALDCRIQATYLSRSFALNAHLNSDQLWNICHHLHLTKHETQYILTLAAYQQSTVQSRKKDLLKELKAYEKNISAISNLFQSKKSDKVPDDFHLDTLAQLVLQYFIIKPGTSNFCIIAQSLGATPHKVEKTIAKLLKYNLLEENAEGEYQTTTNIQAHLSSQHTLFPTFFRNRLLFALDHFDHASSSNSIHFSVMFTSNDDFQQQLQAKIRELIKWSESEVQKHTDEEVYILNIHANQLSNIKNPSNINTINAS